MPAFLKKKRAGGRFWETKKLEELTAEEWELLCDRCALCCFHKIEDADTGQVYYINRPCRLLDPATRLCRHYERRHEFVPECATLTPAAVRQYTWLPETCAYRRLAEGRPLPATHPLLKKGGC